MSDAFEISQLILKEIKQLNESIFRIENKIDKIEKSLSSANIGIDFLISKLTKSEMQLHWIIKLLNEGNE